MVVGEEEAVDTVVGRSVVGKWEVGKWVVDKWEESQPEEEVVPREEPEDKECTRIHKDLGLREIHPPWNHTSFLRTSCRREELEDIPAQNRKDTEHRGRACSIAHVPFVVLPLGRTQGRGEQILLRLSSFGRSVEQ